MKSICNRRYFWLLVVLYGLCPFFMRASVEGSEPLNTDGSEIQFYERTWFIVLLCLVLFSSIFFFLRFYSSFSLDYFESYTTYNEQIVKIRILGILALILFPLTEYYESVYLKLYPTDWIPVLAVVIVSIISLLASFYKNISSKATIFLPQFAFALVYSALSFKCIKSGSVPILSIETACLLLFSKLIFTRLVSFLYFLGYILCATLFFFYLFGAPEQNADIYISATLQAALVTLAMFLLEGNSQKNVLFGNKILESSNLFVFVSDKNANIVFINPYLTELTGLQQNNLLKQGWWNYLNKSKEDLEAEKKINSEIIASGQSVSYESVMTNPQGKSVHIAWQRTVVDRNYILTVGKDISDRKAYENEIILRQEKTNRYHAAVYKLTTYTYSNSQSFQDVIQFAVKFAAETLKIERFSIWDFNGEYIECKCLYSALNGEFKGGEILHKLQVPKYFEAISNARIVNAADAFNHPDTKEFCAVYFPENNICSLLDVPIFVNGELKGVVCAEATRTYRNWDSEDTNFVKDIADFISLTGEAQKRKELENDYSYILNNAGDIIYTTNETGNIVYINHAITKILGFTTDWLIGKHFSEIIHPDFQELAAQFYLKQFEEKIDTTYHEFKVLKRKGEPAWVGQNVKLLLSKSSPGHILGFQAVMRDITKQKETELALKLSENNFRQITETINDVFYLYNIAKQKYEYISPNCSKILGIEAEQVYSGDNVMKIIHQDDLSLVLDAQKKIENKGLPYEIEYRIRRNGEIRWIGEKSTPIFDHENKLVRNSGICRDITDVKQREAQLNRLSLVAQRVSNGVVITNSEGKMEWCNESFLKLTGYTLEELLGKRPIEVLSGPNTDNEIKAEVISDKLENKSIEILQYTKFGTPIWILINNTPLKNSRGEITNYIEVVTDITERKALEYEYAYIINNAGDVIYTTDERGHVKFINEAIMQILGYHSEELLGQHFTEIIDAQDRKQVLAFYLRQFKELKPTTYREFRVIRKNGTIAWVGQNVKLITDPLKPDVTIGFQAVLRDITKQKETELALVTSESNFRQINETINDVFFLYNTKEKRYDYMSPNCIKVLGAPAEFFYSKKSYTETFIIEKDREVVLKAYEKVDAGGEYEIEFRIRVENEIRWINEKSFAIKNAEGEVVKSSGICLDVTQRKMQEKKLLRINKELSLYSEDLAINNLLKEQLIYTNNFEEITKVAFATLKTKIIGIARGTLLLVNESNSGFESFFVDDIQVEKDTFEFSDIKSFEVLTQGRKYIEHDLNTASNISNHDAERRKDEIQSYILLPIMYSGHLIGALGLEFKSTFELSKSQITILENFTSVLSVVVNKLTLQKALTEKSDDVIASLNYAEIIQQSILPNINHYSDVVKNFMRLYMPRDVVSGDFYWIESVEDNLIIALGDCTGHGVPGAFLTLLGSNFLQRIAVENKITNPAEIMELLDFQLYTSLNKNREGIIRDGMELGICTYNRKNHTLTFAGAGLFLMYYKDNEQYVINGSKRSIGDQSNSKIEFEETTVSLNGTEKFYMFSDGYRDQLGGDKRKRFSRNKFFNLLHSIKNLPPFQQEFILRMEHNKHRAKYQQTDDISVIGFELI